MPYGSNHQVCAEGCTNNMFIQQFQTDFRFQFVMQERWPAPNFQNYVADLTYSHVGFLHNTGENKNVGHHTDSVTQRI